MDSAETPNESLRCLICWELKGPEDFPTDSLYGRNEYCIPCDAIQRAHTKAQLVTMYNWKEPTGPYRFVLNGMQIGERWQDYIIEYVYGSLFAAMTQRHIFSPERYRGSKPPLLGDIETPLVWRIRLFHTQRKGYAEGWWNLQTAQWDWSLNKIHSDMPTKDWSEWRKAMRDAAAVGRPAGNALIFLSSTGAFLTRCREAVSEHGWPEASQGMDAITRKQILQRVREGSVTQAQLGEILRCGHRTITLALARFRESDHLDWRDLQGWLAEWSREP